MSNGDPAGLRPPPFYWLSRAVVRLVAKLFLNLTVVGAERFPSQGGVLVVANHLSVGDPPLVASACRRPLAFMGKIELFRNRFQGAVLRGWRVFPVRRGEIDVGAVRMALGLLRAGNALMVFPEGTRRPAGLGPAQPGIGYFAARSGCPVLPVAIEGTELIRSLWSVRQRPTVRITFGEPFVIPREHAEMGAELIMRAIAALLPPKRRGQYAVPAGTSVGDQAP